MVKIPTKEELIKLYIEEKRNQEEIAKIFSVHRKTVGRWLKKYSIKKTRKEITSDFNESYFKEHGVKTPAERAQVRAKMVSTNLRKYGNPSSLHGTRQSELEKILKEKLGVVNPSHLKLSKETREILLSKESLKTFLLSEDNTSSKIISQKLMISVCTFNRYIKKYGLEEYVDRQLSRGASFIEDFLTYNDILFEKEKTFPGCEGDHRPLFFDFYISELNLLIEFDGRQHFIPVEFWGGEDGLIKRQKYDTIKNNYAKKHNIKLIRFNYLQSEEEIKSQLMENMKI